jgi:hypothetical protein
MRGRFSMFTTPQTITDVPKICIHKYLKHCKTNPQPPGFGDFIRGTIALFYFSKKYNYELLVDDEHEIFRNLKQHKSFTNNHLMRTLEFLPPQSYHTIYNNIDRLFSTNQSCCVMTNSFYLNKQGILENWGDITDECRTFMRELLTPNQKITDNIDFIFNRLAINPANGYNVIHLRLGDRFLHNDHIEDGLLQTIIQKINTLNRGAQYILLSDSASMAMEIVNKFPSIFYWNGKKIHIGDLKNNENVDFAVTDTMTDFFIMSKCKKIYYYSDSGFSKAASLIFDKKYLQL